jgi:hypothetical protein
MEKWNMIIDVAECTNCNLCTLATMDEYVGNEWPGYSAPMPKHGHRWISILQKERGQAGMIDVAFVPTMCNHCDDAPCVSEAKGTVVDCVEGASVRLMQENRVIAKIVTDAFGDFTFDRFDENSGPYAVVISARDGRTKTIEAKLGESVNVGEVRL